MQESEVEVKIKDQLILETKLTYLGFIIQEDGPIDDDAAHRIRVMWVK